MSDSSGAWQTVLSGCLFHMLLLSLSTEFYIQLFSSIFWLRFTRYVHLDAIKLFCPLSFDIKKIKGKEIYRLTIYLFSERFLFLFDLTLKAFPSLFLTWWALDREFLYESLFKSKKKWKRKSLCQANDFIAFLRGLQSLVNYFLSRIILIIVRQKF